MPVPHATSSASPTASHVLHRAGSFRPPTAVSGDGIWLTLSDGRRIVDASGGAAVACLGHGNRRVAEAVARQARRLGYVHTGFFTTEPAEELADLLVGDHPGGLERAFFVSSGSEAMESALKLARQYFFEIGQPQRTHFISRRQGYHGNTLGAMALSGNLARRIPYEDILPTGFSQVSPCFPYHYQAPGESDAAYVRRLARELEQEILRIGADRVAAFFAETVVGAVSGCVLPTPGYFQAMREVCDRHGVLLVLDEVMCGLGRTGLRHAWEREGVVPDIQGVAKGLGGGYQPIGAILVSGRVMGALSRGSGSFVHGHTYQAHPVACVAALEVQRIIREQDLVANVERMGRALETGLRQRFGDHPHVGDIRGAGLFRAMEFVRDRDTREPFDPALHLQDRLKHVAIEHGIGVYPTGGTLDGRRGDHVLIAPPYNVTGEEIEVIVDRLHAAVNATFARLPPA